MSGSTFEEDSLPPQSVSELQKYIYEWAVRKGWWPKGETVNIEQKLLLMVSEIVEALEELRNHHKVDEIYFTQVEIEGVTYQKPEGIPIELADVVIRVLDFCGHFGIDLEGATRTKMRFNEKRSFRHGGKSA